MNNKYQLKVDKSTFNDYNPKLHCVYKKKVKELDLTAVKPQRAGIILYTKMNEVFYFGLGVDTMTKEYTDFGGGISYKDKFDKNVIAGALREFNEETLNIFGDWCYDDVQDSLALYNLSNLIIFKYITVDSYNELTLIKNTFLTAYQDMTEHGIKPEVCDIEWLTLNELKVQITMRDNLFHRIQFFLQKAGQFFWML